MLPALPAPCRIAGSFLTAAACSRSGVAICSRRRPANAMASSADTSSRFCPISIRPRNFSLSSDFPLKMNGNQGPKPVKNRLLESLPAKDKALIASGLQEVVLERGAVLFEPGEEVVDVYFPTQGMVGALVLDLKSGISAEAAMIGQEGAIGGIISEGDKPAFARAAVQMEGKAFRLSTDL